MSMQKVGISESMCQFQLAIVDTFNHKRDLTRREISEIKKKKLGLELTPEQDDAILFRRQASCTSFRSFTNNCR